MEERMVFSENDLFMVCKENHDCENRFNGKKDFLQVSDGEKIEFWSLESRIPKGNLIFFPPNGGNLSFIVDFFESINT